MFLLFFYQKEKTEKNTFNCDRWNTFVFFFFPQKESGNPLNKPPVGTGKEAYSRKTQLEPKEDCKLPGWLKPGLIKLLMCSHSTVHTVTHTHHLSVKQLFLHLWVPLVSAPVSSKRAFLWSVFFRILFSSSSSSFSSAPPAHGFPLRKSDKPHKSRPGCVL